MSNSGCNYREAVTSNPESPAVDAQDLLEEVRTTSLPDQVAELADEYERICGERDRFLWQWIYSLFPEFTLSSVHPDLGDHAGHPRRFSRVPHDSDDIVENDVDRAASKRPDASFRTRQPRTRSAAVARNISPLSSVYGGSLRGA